MEKDSSRESHVYHARLAEQAERYDGIYALFIYSCSSLAPMTSFTMILVFRFDGLIEGYSIEDEMIMCCFVKLDRLLPTSP